ncbi:putative RNA methylase [Cotonvirus japonicus]|uniref:RNA methylase n=1 Tax=Cotonvirus japonicus TaxID=2811091 RepID=A0ABM7NSX0_9VIRU|nr:putative RNA methylase [Cotonvirus japonicus]BCS83265.1 putative RNA methylase [Cotonvirus japonicus]
MDISIYYPKKYNGHKKFLTNKNSKSNKPHQAVILKKLIFPPISENRIPFLMIDNESIKYITFNVSAQEITNIIMNSLHDFPCPIINNLNKTECDINKTECDINKKIIKWSSKSLENRMKKLVITEMTAGVGGNVLNFAKYFKYVNAIEINNERYKYLNNNIKLYDYTNVNCYNNNSIDLLIEKDDIIQNIIFFDPPWGGNGYKLYHNLKLMFDKYTIEQICDKLFERNYNKMIVLKLPINYDFDYLSQQLNKFTISKFILNKMVIIVIKNY